MTANDPAALVAWIREQHRGWNPNNPCSACQFCGESWPCRTTQAADTIEALLAERDSLLDANAQDRAWIEAHADQPVRLHDAEQEVARLREHADAMAKVAMMLKTTPENEWEYFAWIVWEAAEDYYAALEGGGGE